MTAACAQVRPAGGAHLEQPAADQEGGAVVRAPADRPAARPQGPATDAEHDHHWPAVVARHQVGGHTGRANARGKNTRVPGFGRRRVCRCRK